MRKKVVIISTVSCLIFGFWIYSFIGKDTNALKTNHVESSETNIYQTIISESEFAEVYDDYEDLIANAELIAFGTVNHVNSYMEDIRIKSKFEFKVSSVEKGEVNVNDTISVITQGGKVTFSEYLDAYGEILAAKTSTKEMEKERKLHGNEYVESICDGIPNIKEGDQLLLFLLKLENTSDYYILGGSYFGKLYYDENNNRIYKEVIEDASKINSTKYTTKMEKKINKNEFKKKVKETKDKSKKNREERERLEWELNEEYREVEKDPAFDKYKK